ncbi:MAG: hypothetical protein N2593_02455 [Patescibacteria group bacterium]|nr:hypothetical protein [Patescibacteria group bacterium]
MNLFLFFKNLNLDFKKKEKNKKLEFISFVEDQFKKITKKKLKIPITLYNL